MSRFSTFFRYILMLFLGLWLMAPVLSASAQELDYAQLKAQAEKEYQDKSYSRAYALYQKAEALKLAEADQRWVRFRLADTLWRSQGGEDPDGEKLEKAREALEKLVEETPDEEERDQLWAATQESLGDYYWNRRSSQDWGSGWQHYQQALEWWAGARDIELARARYLAIVWRCERPAQIDSDYYYGYYGNYLPMDVLDNVLKIVKTPEDLAHAHYLMAMGLYRQGGEWEQRERIPEEFLAALKIGKASEWYDDALFNYAQWMESAGKRTRLPNGQWQQSPDFSGALELYRRLLSEFKKGESRYYEQAKSRIEAITASSVSIQVSNIFLPDSEIQAYLNWHNQKRIELAIYALDLTADVAFTKKQGSTEWLQSVNVAGLKQVKAWIKVVEKGAYLPGSEVIRLDRKLEPGAYVIVAQGEGAKARDLILVSDATLVMKTSGRRVLAFFCNVQDGTPIPQADVKLYSRTYVSGEYVWKTTQKQTNADGLALFELAPGSSSEEVFVAARATTQQAFALTYAYGRSEDRSETWRIYAYTDRSAYRPGEKVQWKMLARTYKLGAYATPAEQSVEYEIHDPHGAKIKEGKLKLNAFGSAWDEAELPATLPLGEYRISFYTAGRKQGLGSALLFRMEEYKLPEFKVAIQTAEENGKKKSYRLGDRVEASIQADYYFGGPVGNASVEVVVYQNPYYRYWVMDHAFPWFYEDMLPRPGYGGQGQVIKRETLKTDAQGRAVVSFTTPRGQQDMEYRIEARVVDASRREIIASDTVKVTRHRYEVNVQAAHSLYRPQDKVTLSIKAQDANQNPVSVSGTVRVTRDRWVEIWLNPSGQQVWADTWRRAHPQGPAVPWAGEKPELGWQMKFQGYEHEDVLKSTVKTNDAGEAEFSFTAAREGYYRVAWESEDDKNTEPVTAETTVWAANNATAELGYRHGGLEIILDKDTVRAGEKAPVLISAPVSGRSVLFSVEGDDLYSYQVLRFNGPVKLVELDIDPKFVPNVFLSATMVSDLQLYQDTKQVVVPPVDHFLKVELKSDKDQYHAQEEGTFTLTTRDQADQPVEAEVSLALVDEAVSYIQADYVGDPRQYYFGTKRSQQVRTDATLNQRSYAKLLKEPPAPPVGSPSPEPMLSSDDREVDMEESAVMGAAASMPASAPMQSRRSSPSKSAFGGVSKKEMRALAKTKDGPIMFDLAEAAPEPEAGGSVVVRQDFRATAFWQPDIRTDKTGHATVKVKYPDSLTAWKAQARVASAGSQFGQAQTVTHTKMPVLVRLQCPRFFLTGDRVTVSAVVNNNTDKEINATVALKAQGVDANGGAARTLQVPAKGEARADWSVEVKQSGEAKLLVEAKAGAYGDAMEKTFPVYEHGLEKFVAKSGKVRGAESTVVLELPRARKTESTSLSVQVAPSLAVALLDALPYLFDYPYGCTEQTLSRFLPAVMVSKTLRDVGVSPESLAGKMFGGVEKTFADKTHAEGPKDFKKLDDMVRQGLDRLYDFQHSDGGWGWWKEGSSDPYMTAYVLWGLTLAKDAGVKVKSGVLERADSYVDETLVQAENQPDLAAWMLFAQSGYFVQERRSALSQYQTKAYNRVWERRDKLNAYTRALLALASEHFGKHEQAKILVRNLEDGVVRDEKPDTTVLHASGGTGDALMSTVHWGKERNYWHWSDGGIEATSFALQAFMAIDPKNALVEPAMNWLVKNRRGAQWSNTRDTALALLGLNEYLRVSRELAQDVNYEVLVNGHSVTNQKVSAALSLGAPSRFEVKREFLKDGANEIRVRNLNPKGTIYFSAQATFFSLEEPITPVGNEMFTRRQYFKFVGRPTLLKGYVYDKVPLQDQESVVSGQRIETVVTVDVKNDYEYLMLEDLKPAGIEAVEVRSGTPVYAQEVKPSAQAAIYQGQGTKKAKLAAHAQDLAGRSIWVYQELRDRKVALFIDKLPKGVWEIRYMLRAETPGNYHALPVTGQAMYVPEIRCNGGEVRIQVQDEK